MRIVIFGASGGTGKELVRQGVERGHQVTAFVRNPHALPTAQGNVRPVVGDALDPQAVSTAIEGQEAVLSALGPRTLAKDPLLPESMWHILAAMKSHSVPRLVVLGAAGVWPGATRDLSAGGKLIMSFLHSVMLKQVFSEHRDMQRQIQNSTTQWTIVQPPFLSNAAGRGQYRVAADTLPSRGMRIARADVAHFMLAQLGSPEWVRKLPYIAW